MMNSFPVFDILIPAYNARVTLPFLLSAIRQVQPHAQNIVVVDDGSTDGTDPPDDVIYLKHGHNRGKGETLKTGFNWFLKNSESSFLCCMDADLQHDPADILQFLKMITLHPGTSVFIGNRQFHGAGMPVHRVLSNWGTSHIINWISGLDVTDSQCGYRFIQRDVLKLMHLRENGFQLESEFFFRLGDLKLQPVFVDITTKYAGYGSHMNHILDTFRFIKLIFKEINRKWFIHANIRQ